MRAALVTGLVLGVLATAGCGGDGASPEAESWASSVCADISQWRAEVETLANEAAAAITSGNASRSEVRSAIDQGLDASRDLVAELRALGPPPTDQGDDAKQTIESLASGVESSVQDVQSALADLPDNPTVTQIVSGLSGLATSLQANLTAAQASVESLRNLGGELKAAFENSDACDELREKS